jgi:hypothetical protein
MNRKTVAYRLIPILLLTACAGSSNIDVRKDPTVNFSLKKGSRPVVLLPSRNFSDHREIDLHRLDGKLLTKLRARLGRVRFITVRQLRENILSGQDREIINNFIDEFKKSGILRAENIKNANSILNVGYFLTPSFGASTGMGYGSMSVFTVSLQIYEGKTGKTAFSVSAEETEENVEGFDVLFGFLRADAEGNRRERRGIRHARKRHLRLGSGQRFENNPLVSRQVNIVGYKRFNFILASLVEKRQSILAF